MTYKHVNIYITIPSWLGSGTARKGPPGIISGVKTEIKKGGKKEVGLYANFQLTNKRKSLMPSQVYEERR